MKKEYAYFSGHSGIKTSLSLNFRLNFRYMIYDISFTIDNKCIKYDIAVLFKRVRSTSRPRQCAARHTASLYIVIIYADIFVLLLCIGFVLS